jgi:nucleotide-binding universal stress UspA family protein
LFAGVIMKMLVATDGSSASDKAIDVAAAVARATAAGVEPRTAHETGSPADCLVEISKREGVAEVFVASHGRHGLARVAMGSVSARVAGWAPCTVTVVK